MARYYQRESLVSLDDKVRDIYLSSENREELLSLADALNIDRLDYLHQKKMGRVRLVNKWIDMVSDKLAAIHNAEFEQISVLGIF